MMTVLRKKCLALFLFFFVCVFSSVSYAQEQRNVKSFPVCLDFSDVYKRAVLGLEESTAEEEREMAALASLMMGYISALQDIYGGRLVGMNIGDNEWTLMEKVYQYCQQYPHLTFQRAVRALSPVSLTIQALQDQEFKRCEAYIAQTKSTICLQANEK